MYCRQLWDDSITDFLQDDAKRELVLRDVINVSKELGMKLQTQSMLASTFEVEQMAVRSCYSSTLCSFLSFRN